MVYEHKIFAFNGLQYTDLEIDITIRPIKELYTIINTDRDISSYIDQQIREDLY